MNENPETRASGMLRRAEELVPVLAERAAETEALRSLPEATIADIRAAGLHTMGKPLRLGGAELPLDAIVRVVATLARGCASTAWVCGVYSDHAMIVGMMDPRVADEIWADEPDALIATGYFPSGTNEPDDGGWRLTGRWGFASGCDYASWAFLGSILAVGDGPPEPHLCLVPIDEVEIDDDWQVMGLAGTGSKTLVADGAFVPRHRAIPLGSMGGGWEARGRPDVPPLYRLPHVSTIPFHFCATALGTAEGLLDDVIADIGERHSLGAPVAEYATMQMRIAAASAGIDCARMLVERDTREAMEAMREGRSLTLAERARNRRDMAYAAQLCQRAAEDLFEAGGARSVYSASVPQRKFRDVRVAANHIILKWDVAGTTYGRVAFGLDPGSPLI